MTRALLAPAFKPSEYTHTNYDATVEAGVTLDDCLAPEFWMHVADKLRPSDKIFVYAADQSFYAELLALSVNRVEARVALIHHVDLSKATNGEELGAELAKYDVSWAGPANKFRIVHKASKDVVKDGFDNEAAARTWLISDHLTQKHMAPRESTPLDRQTLKLKEKAPA